tara:strand:+ start:1458 stop:1700 length:243 start_codon:yes stop_codon:yes gene_type:complete
MPKVRKSKEGAALKRWFKEGWVNVKTGKACGDADGGYCRPTKRVSSKTPKTLGEMSKSERKRKVSEKKRTGRATPARRKK